MVVRVVRALIAAALVMSGLVLATPASAFACSCVDTDLDRQAADADAIFVATVEEVTRAGRDFEYALTATRSYKGDVESDTTVTSSRFTAACGLGRLDVGSDYVFMATGDTSPFTAARCTGSGPATPERLARVERVLGVGTPIVASAPETPVPPTLTKVEGADPMPLSRLAAPGGAVAIVGLLGLLVVARMSRQ